MIRFFSDLTKSISQKRREQIERRKAEIRQRFSSETIHRLADNKLYKLTVDGWVEVQPKFDSDRAWHKSLERPTFNPVEIDGFAIRK